MDILDIVKRECKGDATNEEVSWLRDPANHGVWLSGLFWAISDFESQLLYHKSAVDLAARDAELKIITKNEYLDVRDRFESWHKKALRYRSGLHERLAEVRSLVYSHPDNATKANLQDMIQAITNHKRATLNAGLNPEPHDSDLWSSITLIEQ